MTASDFKTALQEHLNSIKNRDIDAFEKFFSPHYSAMVILPNGVKIEGNEEIIDFHKQWFEDDDWQMETRVVDCFEMENMGYVLLDVDYEDMDEDGKPYQMSYYLSMLFAKTNCGWVLLRDQNTLK